MSFSHYHQCCSPSLDSFDLEGDDEGRHGQERFTGVDVEAVVQQRHLQDVARERQKRKFDLEDLKVNKKFNYLPYLVSKDDWRSDITKIIVTKICFIKKAINNHEEEKEKAHSSESSEEPVRKREAQVEVDGVDHLSLHRQHLTAGESVPAHSDEVSLK